MNAHGREKNEPGTRDYRQSANHDSARFSSGKWLIRYNLPGLSAVMPWQLEGRVNFDAVRDLQKPKAHGLQKLYRFWPFDEATI